MKVILHVKVSSTVKDNSFCRENQAQGGGTYEIKGSPCPNRLGADS